MCAHTSQSRQLHIIQIILRRLLVQVRSQSQHLQILVNYDAMLGFSLQRNRRNIFNSFLIKARVSVERTCCLNFFNSSPKNCFSSVVSCNLFEICSNERLPLKASFEMSSSCRYRSFIFSSSSACFSSNSSTYLVCVCKRFCSSSSSLIIRSRSRTPSFLDCNPPPL